MVEVAALIVTVASLAYAIYQGNQRRELERFIQSEAWYLYAKASNTNSQYQNAMELYKQRHRGDIDPLFIESMAKGDAFGQDLTRETVRLIQLSEPTFDNAQIDAWLGYNKIDPGHKRLFEAIAVNQQTIAARLRGLKPPPEPSEP